MNFSDERNFSSYFIIIAVVVITALVLWGTSLFLKRLKDDERTKIEIWAQSQKALNSELSEIDLISLKPKSRK